MHAPGHPFAYPAPTPVAIPLPYIAYASSSRTRCSACHLLILHGDIRVDSFHLDCITAAHVHAWQRSHPALLRRSLSRLPSLASLTPEDRRRVLFLLSTLAQSAPAPRTSAPSDCLPPIHEESPGDKDADRSEDQWPTRGSGGGKRRKTASGMKADSSAWGDFEFDPFSPEPVRMMVGDSGGSGGGGSGGGRKRRRRSGDLMLS